MILATRRAGDVTVRAGQIGDSTIPSNGSVYASFSGALLSKDRVSGLAAYAAANRLISMTIAAMELCVYQGTGAVKRERDDHPAYTLLQDPAPGVVSPFDFVSDLARCVETDGNWCAFKLRKGRRIVGLDPIPPEHFQIRRGPDGFKVFDVTDGFSARKTYTARDVLHVRGATHKGFLSGFSVMQLYANEIGNALALSEFQGSYFRNGAAPGVVLEMQGRPDAAQAKLILDAWSADHQGLPNAHKPAITWNGTKVTTIPVSASDAQFIESQRFSVEQIARITGVPSNLIEAGTRAQVTTEQDSLRFMKFCILPRAKRILSALASDPDLFPNRDAYPQFEYDDLLAVDAATQAQVEKERVQAGIELVDEIRARKGMPPLPPIPADWTQRPGMVPQITPVGGAPNPTVNTSGTTPASGEGVEATIS